MSVKSQMRPTTVQVSSHSTLKHIATPTVLCSYNLVPKYRLTVHRPGDGPCQECDRRASAEFRGHWRVSTARLEHIRSVHLLTACLSKFKFLVYVLAEQSFTPTKSSPVFLPISSSPSICARHAYHPTGIILWSLLCTQSDLITE
jgi:hypothetical protein